MQKINRTTIITAFSMLGLGLLIGWLIFRTPSQTNSEEHNHSKSDDAETTWTCSMHPQIKRKEPGDCPICGMELIPLESADSDIDPNAISMSPIAIQLAQVQTMVVDKGNIEKSIRLNGKVKIDERLLFSQSSHISGRIEKLSVNFTGEYISKGQVIAHIYSPSLVTAQEELFEAKKIEETQPALFNAAKEKLKNWKLTDKQIEQILVSDEKIEQFPVLANVSGYVTKKMLNLGDYIKEGQAIYEIADLSKVWILFDVYESDMNWIKKGASVSYTVQSIPGKTFDGIITFIDPIIDPKTRVAKARIETKNTDLSLKPEMFVSGTLVAKLKTNNKSIIIPKTAVLWTGKRSVVYVMQQNNNGVSFLMRKVTLGPELGESYQIESGLEPGEEIAINGTFSIDAAAQLSGKPSMMNTRSNLINSNNNHEESSNLSKNKISNDQKKIAISEDAKKSLNIIFDSYFKMKDALVIGDFKKAKEASKTMKISLNNVDMNFFKGDAHNIWMKHSNSLNKDLQQIEQVEDIAALRKYFIDISKTMITIAKSIKPNLETIYIQYCPMANSNEGADWLSLDKKIRNPYFGDAMLTCGKVKKEL